VTHELKVGVTTVGEIREAGGYVLPCPTKTRPREKTGMGKLRVYADFQKTDDSGRLVLTSRGSLADLAGIDVVPGDTMAVVFYGDDADENGSPDDLEVDGILLYDEKVGYWVGVYDRMR
jgi:hypothetical protein